MLSYSGNMPKVLSQYVRKDLTDVRLQDQKQLRMTQAQAREREREREIGIRYYIDTRERELSG